MGIHAEAEKIVSQMTIEEKIKLFVSKDLSGILACKQLDFSGMQMAEGMQKLHYPKEKTNNDLQDIFQTTDYPAVSLLANSFDVELMEKLGQAIGEECIEKEVGLLTGIRPNVVRNPLRGYRERYLSEDPYLNGKLTAGFVRGVQKTGIGACVTSFGTDSRETGKMHTNAILDERAFQEIYGRPYEILVREAKPFVIQTAHQKLNGVPFSENANVIGKILRAQWGYEGAVFSGFGAVNDSITSLEAGIDHELGSYFAETEKELLQAYEAGEIAERSIQQMAVRIVELILRYKEGQEKNLTIRQNRSEYLSSHENQGFRYDRSKHRKLAWTAAQESAVLLKNTGILPLKQKKNIAILGPMAKYPRYQTADCKEEMPEEISSAHQVFLEYGFAFGYADGYRLDTDEVDEELIREAIQVVEGREAVILFVGNPKEQKKDKSTMQLPANQKALLDAVLQMNSRVILVVENDSIVHVPELERLEAVLLMGLAGGQGGRACVNLLSGQANPCGKLAETYPNSARDIPGYRYLYEDKRREEYRESLFVGYRFYDAARRNVQFPFGYGLSYTKFSYGSIECLNRMVDFCKDPNQKVTVDISIQNTGEMDGKEIVELYIHPQKSTALRPEKELKQFVKVLIPKGEQRLISFHLDREAFAYYSPLQKQWVVENGMYEIQIGSSSRNILQSVEIMVEGVEKNTKNLVPDKHKRNKEKLETYYHFPSGEVLISDEEFEALFLEMPNRGYADKLVTVDTTVKELEGQFLGRRMLKQLFPKGAGIDRFDTIPSLHFDKEQKNDIPIYLAAALQGKMTRKKILGWIDICNHKFLQGIVKVIK